MDQNQPSNLFDLHIDSQTSAYLNETAKWAKFFAILGFIACGFFALFAIFGGSVMSTAYNRYGMEGATSPITGAIFTIVYLPFAVLMFFPCLYQFRFATRLKGAIRNNDQELLNNSLKNQRLYFRFTGILTIIGLSLGLLFMILGIFMAATFSR